MTPEAKVKDKIKKILKEHNVYYAMPMGTGYGNAGVPDFLCCVHGKFWLSKQKQVRALQLHYRIRT
jgi:pantoate kinase